MPKKKNVPPIKRDHWSDPEFNFGSEQKMKKPIALARRNGDDVLLSYVGFSKLTTQLAGKGVRNPAAVAAAIGRKKYGAKKFDNAAAKGVKLGKKSKKG